MEVDEWAGMLAYISSDFGGSEVSITAVNQKEANVDDQVTELVIMTLKANEAQMQTVLSEIVGLSIVFRSNSFFSVEW
ncbi:MAG TPA: hypothetical protein QGF35_08635 [Dehalococcoidia bacterium]|jgi:hypothetical protein|nr:hypothetical protein [Dehalococcoidia bacterium]